MIRGQARSPSPEHRCCPVINAGYNMTTMGKESSLEGLKFDGDTVLCRVCGDKASGFHYGVHACEGCKGFFRRSIQQKIQYRPCLKNQQCNIMRVNRNRCQYCRLKKCISVGMSRDAVRFGRVPKKEKARIIEQMQRVNGHSQATMHLSLLEGENVGDLVQAVIDAHRQTCDFSVEKINTLRNASLYKSKYVNCPAHMACPLDNVQRKDANENKQDVEDFPQYFAPAVTSAVDFARLIPGFFILNQDDQITLLKAGTFEVLLIRLANLFDPATNTMMFTNGQLFKRQSAVSNTVGYLMDSMFDFAERFNKLQLTEGELALFSAVVLLSPDRPGLRNTEQVERIQNKLNQGLQDLINTNHRDDSTLFAKLLMKMTDLRTLNTLHSEKSIGTFEGECKDAVEDHTDMEVTDCDMRSETSSPSDTSSFTNNNTASLYSLESESPENTCTASVISQRVPQENHQQVVLRTPYGTFYREETSGFYGFFHDQPRQRCHTLDRDTLTRPRLHRIDEGTRRRNTLDREYISKMSHSLGERLEKRNAVMADSVPPSISSSAASSPIPEDKLYNNREFIPISTADSQSARASPLSRDHLIPFSSSPNSSDPRSRSGSLSADDYQSRPRCYSFNMNSEGRAARKSFSRPVVRTEILDNQQYLSADTRRGSVGASYGLHPRKPSLQLDRNSAYLGQSIEQLVKKRDEPIQHGDAAKLQHHVPLENPATLANGGMQHIISTLTHAWQPMVNPYGNVPSQLAKGSQGPIAPNSQADDNSARNPGTKIVVSDHSQAENLETFPHKKFDKMRKHLQSSTSGNGDVGSSEIHMKETKEKSPEKTESTLTEKQKSAGEAHPQLLAQLKTTTPSMLQYRPITSCQVLANGVRAIQISKPEPNTQPSLKQADLAGTTAEIKEALNSNSKEHAHAVALSHLKDKLLRKYDSMENLQKIAGEPAAPVESAKTERPAPATNVQAVSYPSVPAPHPIGVMPSHRGGMPAYQYFYPAAGQQVPMYNQHLAGMQQLAQMYPNSGQLVRALNPEGGQPLNLVLKIPDGACPIPTNLAAAHVMAEPVWGKK